MRIDPRTFDPELCCRLDEAFESRAVGPQDLWYPYDVKLDALIDEINDDEDDYYDTYVTLREWRRDPTIRAIIRLRATGVSL